MTLGMGRPGMERDLGRVAGVEGTGSQRSSCLSGAANMGEPQRKQAETLPSGSSPLCPALPVEEEGHSGLAFVSFSL